MISVLILTRNEEVDLPGCLASVSWCNDIHVFDSMSNDRTIDIARSAGATVWQRTFDDWSTHQNWGLRNIRFNHPWVFYLDADERMTPDLIAAVKAAVAEPRGNVAFRIERRDHFLGRWLRHCQATSFYVRLFRPEHMRYERLVNPVSIPDGPVGDLDGHLLHFPFSKGVDFWFERHNRYSRLEAEQILANRKGQTGVSLWKALGARDRSIRRFHQKELFYRLPCRPTFRFLLLYIVYGGFLDGTPGFLYAHMQACYERMIVIKVKESLLRKSTPV